MKVVRLAILGLATTSLINCADDTSTPDVDDDGTEIDRGDNGPLTPPSSDAPEKITRDYLGAHVGKAVADQLGMVNQFVDSRGVTHVRMEQVISGLRVHDAYVKAALNGKGQLIQVIHKLRPIGGAVAPASINDADALRTALVEYNFGVEPAQLKTRGNITTFAKTLEMHREPTVERVAYVEGKSFRQGFLVMTWSQHENQLDYTLVGGDGSIVSAERRTSNDRYNVFAEDPLKGAQTIVSGPGAGNAESPAGWLGTATQTTNNISGNNVKAYLDKDANNAPDAGGSSVTNGDFLTAADLSVAPDTTGNKAVAVQNLFYLNNVTHDLLYRHGFNEAAGNFQVNNFGKGGLGNDPVSAEAQDGSGTDNANFATPSDGSAPRMQMYLWSGAAPDSFVTAGGQDRGAYASSFGAAVTLAGTSGALANFVDGTAPAGDGCSASTVSLTGKIAIVDRGTCNFTVKVLNAQNAGAIGVVIVNNTGTNEAFAPGGTERRVKIPSAMVGLADGTALKGIAGTSANLRKNPSPPLQIDGDIDSDIVYHEYGHGLTWRMIGSMSGPLAGAIGEGASDVVAFLVNGDDRIGEYAFSNPLGIRSQPYDTFVGTYGGATLGEVHADGEFFAATMWDVRRNYLAANVGGSAAASIDTLFGDFVGGMNFTPAAPAFEDMRDGMLQQAAGTGRECLIWRAFAARGVGVGADGRTTKGGRSAVITESFALPTQCQ